ncbi:MAG: tetratricopeptide repeat protein [Leptolyngbyaceae cyanobacterium bins.302]|nr:tetratricopeptide repeat protein [Leptolyngbyaceae cyanobacterium bins.302]
MHDRYQSLIDQIITATLQGKIRSKEQVYKMLQTEVSSGTGELFERCLQVQLDDVQAQLLSADELKQAKATRKQRALKTIQTEWERWQQQNQSSAAVANLVQAIATAEPTERLSHLLNAIDPNQPQVLTREQIQQLAQRLQQAEAEPETKTDLDEFAQGLIQGVKSWQEVEANVVSWLFDRSQAIGFGAPAEEAGPWATWAKSVSRAELKQIFQDLANHQTITHAGIPSAIATPVWIELAVVLQRLQLGLVSWLDKQPYDRSAGKRLSIATYLTFTVVWSQLSQRFYELGQSTLAEGCFQVALQSLYQFAQQDYFPLYGGLFAALSGESLRVTLDYLDKPLRQVPNTQSKARIITLLGYSQRALGQYPQAIQLHQWALEIARDANDRRCEIANLNHLSRTFMAQKNYEAAIGDSQRALILARQLGDRLGEANALATLGCSEVLQSREQAALDADQYERLLDYLQRGLQLSEQEGDRPSQALCAYSLGIAQVALQQYAAAIETLKQGLHIAQAIGDLFLQGMNCVYLAEAYYGSEEFDTAIYLGCLGMYLLHQIESDQWRQPAGTLSILSVQIGAEAFQAALTKYRPQFLQQIGVDGYDYLPTLLEEYRRSL